jgi:hypothetical protein
MWKVEVCLHPSTNCGTTHGCAVSFRPRPFNTRRKLPGTNLTGGCVGPRAFLDVFRCVRKIAKSDYKLRHVCITPAVYTKTIYRSPVGRPVITFYTLCLGGNLRTGLPLQISTDWNLIFEVRNGHATKWTTRCCISQHAEHFNVSLQFDNLKVPANNSRLKSNHCTHCPTFEVYTTGTIKKPGSNPIYTKLISIVQTYISSAIVGQVPK